MNTALVCIAKDEDHYLDEWLSYHMKLGFSEVFVYQNNWRYKGDKSAYGNVRWIDFDGEARQLPAYNDFIDNHNTRFDFAAFFDVDEYLCLPTGIALPEFLIGYEQFPAVGINWRCFGDSGMKDVVGGNYSLVNRFLMCEKTLNKHIKTILNFNICHGFAHFVNPHFVDAAMSCNFTVDVGKKTFIRGPFNEIFTYGAGQLNHYNSKTFEEFSHKFVRGKADTPKNHPAYNYTMENFYRHNHNDVMDTTARDFYANV